MTEMNPQTRRALREAIADASLADRVDVDTGLLTGLDEMPEEQAVEAIDEVYRQIHFDE
jgi:hypothetical protein